MHYYKNQLSHRQILWCPDASLANLTLSGDGTTQFGGVKRFLRIDVVPTPISAKSTWEQKIEFLDKLELVMVNEVITVDHQEIKTVSEVRFLSYDAEKVTEATFTLTEGQYDSYRSLFTWITGALTSITMSETPSHRNANKERILKVFMVLSPQKFFIMESLQTPALFLAEFGGFFFIAYAFFYLISYKLLEKIEERHII